MTATDWIVPGAQVAEYDSHYYDSRVILTTIEKLTPTQVVCANGTRWHRNKASYGGGLKSVGGSGRQELLPLTNQRVRDAVARELLNRVRTDADRICRDQRGGADAVLGALDQIESAIDEARRKLADLDPEAKLDVEATS